MGIINFAKPVTGNFLVDIILWLVTITSSVAWGIILFTVLLKLITLPFDYMSRASMRKNSLKMEEMRPELEKLQEQCANNKDLYNQKMMALYKKNGYSMFGACLPTILTLVIFIVAINGFTAYSKYQNREYFYNMSLSYNSVLYSGIETDDNYITFDKDNKVLIVKDDDIKNELADGGSKVIDVEGKDFDITISHNKDEKFITLETTNGFVQYKRAYRTEENSDKITWSVQSFIMTPDAETKINNNNLASEYNNNLLDSNGHTFTEAKAENAELTLENFILDIQQFKSAETFREENSRFLWVKNIWVADNATKHPVEKEWKSFKQLYGYPSDGNDILDEGYNNLIAKLDFEKNAPNGYFILVALTAGISLLMQFVMNKSQKASMELQTVDGQGAQTQKIMMWMMPIMMAVFSFMYTAAFSIYIILSSVISIGTTFLINFIVDIQMKRKKNKDTEKEQTIRGRVYTKPEEPKEDKNKKNKKNKDFDMDSDFLSGKADQKHIRGRIK